MRKSVTHCFWKNSAWDSLLVIILVLDAVLVVGVVAYGDSIEQYLFPAVWAVVGISYFYNVIVVNHELSHTPFFCNTTINHLFRIFNSMALFYPMSIIEESHRLHHVYNNDQRQGDIDTGDPLSTYRFGTEGKQQHVLSYVLTNFILGNKPSEIRRFYSGARRRVPLPVFVAECASIVLFSTILLCMNWLSFVILILPSCYIGWVLSDLQNYYEHHRATDQSNKYSNSVSYYGWLYNIIMFNEGYHQEHHLRPKGHWLSRPNIRLQFAKELKQAHSHVSTVPPLLGYFDRNK